MLPTIVGLNAIKLAQSASNDAGRSLVARDERGRFVPLSKAVANDKTDSVGRTLDRIMARHNGHDRPIPRAANEPTSYEKTMDRIMQRHNGHHLPLEEPANDTKNRIFHQPAGPLLQADRNKNEPNWEPYVEKPLLLRKRHNGDEELGETSVDKTTKTSAVLKRIEKNTEKSTDLLEEMLELMHDREDGMGVDSLRAREMAKEIGQGNRPWDRNSFLESLQNKHDMDKLRDKFDKKQGLIDAGKKFLGALAMLGIGALASVGGEAIGLEDEAPGGGHRSRNQSPGRTADNLETGVKEPTPSPRPELLPDWKPTGKNAGHLGAVSEEFESGGRGVGTISSGRGDPGGVSYGRYQLSSKAGTMAAFLRSQDGAAFKQHFNGSSPGSKSFNARYSDLVNSNGEAFDNAQYSFLKRTHYDPVEAMARKAGVNTSNRGVQEALWSQSIQHSGKGNQKIIMAMIQSGEPLNTPEEIIRALYKHRDEYARKNRVHYNASTGRYKREMPKALAMIDWEEKKAQLAEAQKEADMTTWNDESKSSTRMAARDLKANKGKARKMPNGSTITNHGKSSTIILNSPRKADAGAEQLAARLAAEKKRAPSAKPSESWSDLAKKYFGW